jgi:N-acetylglucosamine kinase-like BadF-type ATPase
VFHLVEWKWVGMGAGVVGGVDVGGTKTQIRVACRDGTVAERIVETAAWRTRDVAADARAVGALLGRVDAVAVGAHGCDTQAACDAFRTALEQELGTVAVVVNDAELMVPAAGIAEGIGLVAGTGSIAVARRSDQTMLVAGGWGWILGDEGSAPALVREAARAVRASLDRGEAPDLLADALLAALGASDPTEFGKCLQAIGSAAGIGRHAPVVFAAAQSGSALAARVIRDAGRALAGLVRQLVDRGAPAGCVVAGGGVISSQPLLADAFGDAMQAILPQTEIVLLRVPPVLGALRLAERAVMAQRRARP